MPFGSDPTLGAMTQPQAVNPNATPEEKMAYEAGWTDYLSRPEVRAGLLQFGLQAMQPVPIQQSGGGALANAIGSGAQAYDRNVIAQGESAQQDVKNALAQDELGVRNRQVDVSAEGNQLQYNLGMAGLKSKEDIANKALAGKQRVAEIMADSRESAATKAAVAQFSIYNPDATREQVEQFKAEVGAREAGAGAGPATTGPVTGGPAAISTQEEYQALPPGSKYTVPNDPQTYTKPAATQ